MNKNTASSEQCKIKLPVAITANRDLRRLIINHVNNKYCRGRFGAILFKKETYENSVVFLLYDFYTPSIVIKYPWAFICAGDKPYYFDSTRVQRAKLLQKHIMAWSYGAIEKLVKVDPEVLLIQRYYHMNHWTSEQNRWNAVPKKNSDGLQLSGFGYAWLAGDENLIMLFERLGSRLMDEDAIAKKSELSERSLALRITLSNALYKYADGGDPEHLKPLWLAAPQWVIKLCNYLSEQSIQGETHSVGRSDLFSSEYRSTQTNQFTKARAGNGWREPREDLAKYIADYLSESCTHKNTVSNSDTESTAQSMAVKSHK